MPKRQACNFEYNLEEIKLNSEFYFADIYIFPSVTGRLMHIDTSKIPKENLEQIELKKTPWDVIHTNQVVENVIGHVIARGRNLTEAINNAKNIIKEIKFEYLKSFD